MESAVPNPVTTSIRVALGLALVVGLIYIVCLILKKIQENKIGTNGGPIMELVSTINLGFGPGKSVHVVRVTDRFFVIGATNAGITLLTELDGDSLDIRAEDESHESNGLREAQPDGGRRFDELLAAYTQKFVRRGGTFGGLEDKKDER